MNNKTTLFLILFLIAVIPLFAADRNSPQNTNPLLGKFNEVIRFADLNAENIKEATEVSIKEARESLEKLYAIPKEKRNFDNTMVKLDDIYNNVEKVYNPIYLMANVHPDMETYNKANESISEFSKFYNEIQLDENLYKAVKDYSETEEAKSLTGYKAKFLKETVDNFERNGFALSKEKRNELKAINDKISDLGILFEKNIAEVKDYLLVEEKDMEGLPDDYKKNHLTEDGKYRIGLAYPSYIPFMQLSNSETARKELYTKFLNRASADNPEILIKVLMLRKQMAELLGYKTFAEYRVADRMAKLPQNVWNFENNLIDKLKEKARMDYDELLNIKRAKLNDESIDVIQPWESAYYNNLLLKEKYELDQNLVKEYFEANNVINGLFKISQNLFGVEFEEIESPSLWHKDARAFNVNRDGKLISRFYIDLFPRENKFSHAGCFRMIGGKSTGQGYQMPTATFVCNFQAPTEEKPSLLLHGEVETFFHEFGHLLHNVLTTAELSSQSGTAVARDFVEAPSTILENWTWNYESLKLFAKHYKTGEVLPEKLFEKMVAAKNVGSGLQTLQQVFYGIIDFTFNDKYDPTSNQTTTALVKELQNKITLYPFLDGTHMQASFGHLMGYAAAYYGYLWATVYAQDMFSIFEENGIFDKATGLRLRDIILARGGSKDEMKMVIEFLGREPKQDAFFKSIGLDVMSH